MREEGGKVACVHAMKPMWLPVAEVVGEGDGGAQRERDVAAERHAAGQGDDCGHLFVSPQKRGNDSVAWEVRGVISVTPVKCLPRSFAAFKPGTFLSNPPRSDPPSH